MQPEHAVRGLLALGPITREEFLKVTGWSREKAKEVMGAMHARGEIAITFTVNDHGQMFWLREHLPPDIQERAGPPNFHHRPPKKRHRRA